MNNKNEHKTVHIYKSSEVYFFFAYIVSLSFIGLGLFDFIKDFPDGIIFILIGAIHLSLVLYYVVRLKVYPEFIRIIQWNDKEDISWESIKSINQIPYCTRRLWLIRFNESRRSVLFFSSSHEMMDYLKRNAKCLSYL